MKLTPKLLPFFPCHTQVAFQHDGSSKGAKTKNTQTSKRNCRIDITLTARKLYETQSLTNHVLKGIRYQNKCKKETYFIISIHPLLYFTLLYTSIHHFPDLKLIISSSKVPLIFT